MCGEQIRPRYVQLLPLGSPPRVRGTGGTPHTKGRRLRITPACAGNRGMPLIYGCSVEDHPRVCGEQITPSPKIPCLTGSPPRVRGTVSYSSYDYSYHRITPACAGNSKCHGPVRVSHLDHPRVCGEQDAIMDSGSSKVGSPPRVRGTALKFVPI